MTLENADVGPADTPVENVVQPGPVTFRPHVPVGMKPPLRDVERLRQLATA